MIEARSLAKSFGEIEAVRDVSFVARDGEITGLLGPNGAGKSTTLRMLYTVLQPDGGSALIDGVDALTDPQDARRRIGVFSHNPGIYENLTARENIRYFGELCGMQSAELDARVDALNRFFGLEEILDRRCKGFSQGQRTKVALARAMVHNPQNVLLDEPTNGLDVMTTRALRDLIRSLRAENRCVIFSSHIMQEVTALCDRVVIVNDGRVVADGSPTELREQSGEDDLEESFVRLLSG